MQECGRNLKNFASHEINKCRILHIHFLFLLFLGYVIVLTYADLLTAAPGQTECQYRREAALANAVPGAPLPHCTSEGGYDKVQCTDSSCYCVDMRGKEIPGTKLSIADGKPKCDNPGM